MTSFSFLIAFHVFIFGLLAFDLKVRHGKSHVISLPEAIRDSIFYIVMAVGFGIWVYATHGPTKGIEFFTGYLIEKSLSMDNLFVISAVFAQFHIPRDYQRRVLFWGILGALIMRGAMILLGTWLIHQYPWIHYVFGAFLIYTGVKMIKHSVEKTETTTEKIKHFFRRYFRISPHLSGEQFIVIKNGKRLITPLFLALVVVELMDVMFAVDSIPAIFAITSDPMIVYTSNVFAILGLRSFYFALDAIMHRFHYLKYGLCAILVFVGLKIMGNAYWKDFISASLSLFITLFLLASTIAWSYIKPPRDSAEAADPDQSP